MENKEIHLNNECWYCEFKRAVPGNAHISCVNPDPDMTGNEHGIKHGWFSYPYCFDPVWKTAKCKNFKEKK
ncbi:MAG: hypothetical protein H8D23_18830 [Candidatus Brocadiales bacterium]|nr:hypothetical protein [Candidatus Brocadiales bacterium]